MVSENKSLQLMVFEKLRDRIVYGVYAPGMSLPEKEICEEFGVSRTPLREAILKLQAMNLVTVIPRYGTSVSPVDLNEIKCAFELKTDLEGLACELAAARIDAAGLEAMGRAIVEASRIIELDERERHLRLLEIEARFHEIVRQAAGNPILHEFLENLHFRCARLWSLSLSKSIPDQDLIEQMSGVYEALKAGDAKTARRLMENHVQYFVDKIRMQLL